MVNLTGRLAFYRGFDIQSKVLASLTCSGGQQHCSTSLSLTQHKRISHLGDRLYAPAFVSTSSVKGQLH